MTTHKALHLRDDIDRFYVSRKEGGRGLTNIETYIDSRTRKIHKKRKKYELHSVNFHQYCPVQMAEAVEYINCKTPPNECPVYDIKPSDDEIPVLEFWGI